MFLGSKYLKKGVWMSRDWVLIPCKLHPVLRSSLVCHLEEKCLTSQNGNCWCFLFEVCFAKGDFLGLICLKEHLFAIRFIIISGMWNVTCCLVCFELATHPEKKQKTETYYIVTSSNYIYSYEVNEVATRHWSSWWYRTFAFIVRNVRFRCWLLSRFSVVQ